MEPSALESMVPSSVTGVSRSEQDNATTKLSVSESMVTGSVSGTSCTIANAEVSSSVRGNVSASTSRKQARSKSPGFRKSTEIFNPTQTAEYFQRISNAQNTPTHLTPISVPRWEPQYKQLTIGEQDFLFRRRPKGPVYDAFVLLWLNQALSGDQSGGYNTELHMRDDKEILGGRISRTDIAAYIPEWNLCVQLAEREHPASSKMWLDFALALLKERTQYQTAVVTERSLRSMHRNGLFHSVINFIFGWAHAHAVAMGSTFECELPTHVVAMSMASISTSNAVSVGTWIDRLIYAGGAELLFRQNGYEARTFLKTEPMPTLWTPHVYE